MTRCTSATSAARGTRRAGLIPVTSELSEPGAWRQSPQLREVRGTNRSAIGWHRDDTTGRAIVVTAIDNLGKGAAGQAVECLNVMLGLPETAGLEAPALVP